jgi:urease accessory protein
LLYCRHSANEFKHQARIIDIMLKTSKLIFQGQGLAPALLKRAAMVELDWDLRQKSRFETTDSQGRVLGVFLPRGTVLRGGDVLVVEDGSLIRIVAAPQNVLRITPHLDHGNAFDLTRAAYHLGNRHVPIELKPDHLKIEPDHVLADLLRAMHLTVQEAQEAFEPESGAYATGGHAHGTGHEHSHQPTINIRPIEPAHVHGPGCAHEHPVSMPVAAPVHVHGPHCKHEH